MLTTFTPSTRLVRISQMKWVVSFRSFEAVRTALLRAGISSERLAISCPTTTPQHACYQRRRPRRSTTADDDDRRRAAAGEGSLPQPLSQACSPTCAARDSANDTGAFELHLTASDELLGAARRRQAPGDNNLA